MTEFVGLEENSNGKSSGNNNSRSPSGIDKLEKQRQRQKRR
jgi:hypothetical protein